MGLWKRLRRAFYAKGQTLSNNDPEMTNGTEEWMMVGPNYPTPEIIDIRPPIRMPRKELNTGQHRAENDERVRKHKKRYGRDIYPVKIGVKSK